MEKVSIIIPVYNVEKYIEKCLLSVINQTYKNLEILIVNDGTKDNSVNIIKKVMEETKDERIILLEKENGGLSSARNYGMKYATGTYIIFIDSDDYIDKYMAERLVKKAEEGNYDLVETNYCLVYEENMEIKKIPNIVFDNISEFLAKGRVNVSNKLFCKEIIDKYNLQFQEGVYYEDIGFSQKYVLNCKNISYIDDISYYYLQRGNSIIGSKSPKGKLDIIKVFEDLINYYKVNNFFDKYYDEIEYLTTRIILGSSYKRMINIEDKKIREEYIEKTYNFLIDNFPKYKKNKYLRQKSKLSTPKLRFKENIKNLVLRNVNLDLLKFIGKIKR